MTTFFFFFKQFCLIWSLLHPVSNRNVSSERSEARRKLRECTGLVDSLMYIVQSQINRKDVDNKASFQLTLSENVFINLDTTFCLESLTLLSCFCAVGGELCLPLEESVLSGSP